MDADDLGIIAKGTILFVMLAVVLLALAGVAGLAWTVFRLTGGL